MGKKRQYSKENRDKAVDYVRNGGALSKAARLYNVPRSTIQFKLKNPDTKFKSGPDPIISPEGEKHIANWVIQLAKQGFPRKKEDIKSCIQSYLNENPRPNPFKDNRPGDGGFKAFLKRNPEITERTAEGVTNASSCVAEKDILTWFSDIMAYFEEQNIVDVLNDPSRVFNAEETIFNICSKTGKVLAEKSMKTSSKENITVMFGFSASGKTLNPQIVYPYKRIPERISASLPPSWGISRSDKGWMTAQLFYEYVANVFYPQLRADAISFPVVLFVDGHKTHLSQEVTNLCVELGIHLIALYPNATRILQPADVAAFMPLKTAWQKALRENNYTEPLNKLTFGPLLYKIIKDCVSKDALVNGFRVTGLCPFDPDNVDLSKSLANNK